MDGVQFGDSGARKIGRIKMAGSQRPGNVKNRRATRALDVTRPKSREGAAKSVDPARSAQMALVKSRNTKPELKVRAELHRAGLRYVLHDRRLPGKPDLVFPSRKIALFVHGCFWHRHENCAAARVPKTRQEFWLPKLNGNVARDTKQASQLKILGWKVMVIWECEVKKPEKLRALATRIFRHKKRFY